MCFPRVLLPLLGIDCFPLWDPPPASPASGKGTNQSHNYSMDRIKFGKSCLGRWEPMTSVHQHAQKLWWISETARTAEYTCRLNPFLVIGHSSKSVWQKQRPMRRGVWIPVLAPESLLMRGHIGHYRLLSINVCQAHLNHWLHWTTLKYLVTMKLPRCCAPLQKRLLFGPPWIRALCSANHQSNVY